MNGVRYSLPSRTVLVRMQAGSSKPPSACRPRPVANRTQASDLKEFSLAERAASE